MGASQLNQFLVKVYICRCRFQKRSRELVKRTLPSPNSKRRTKTTNHTHYTKSCPWVRPRYNPNHTTVASSCGMFQAGLTWKLRFHVTGSGAMKLPDTLNQVTSHFMKLMLTDTPQGSQLYNGCLVISSETRNLRNSGVWPIQAGSGTTVSHDLILPASLQTHMTTFSSQTSLLLRRNHSFRSSAGAASSVEYFRIRSVRVCMCMYACITHPDVDLRSMVAPSLEHFRCCVLRTSAPRGQLFPLLEEVSKTEVWKQ